MRILFKKLRILANWPATPAFARHSGSTSIKHFWTNKETEVLNIGGQTNRQSDRQIGLYERFQTNKQRWTNNFLQTDRQMDKGDERTNGQTL